MERMPVENVQPDDTTSSSPRRPAPSADLSVLRDGTVVTISPIQPSDAAALERFHASLSQETTRLRFFTVHPRLTDREVTRFTTVDHHAREALVMWLDDEIIAVGRYDADAGNHQAEVAFVVRDDEQGHGAATVLLTRLAERAKEEGISRFVADTLADNRRMLEVFEHTGWQVSSGLDCGVVHVVMDLQRASGAVTPFPNAT